MDGAAPPWTSAMRSKRRARPPSSASGSLTSTPATQAGSPRWGPWFVLIGVRTLDALRRIAVDPTVYEDVAAGGWLAVYAFAEEPYNAGASFAARMLIPFNGPREDPATGSANTAFAAYLRCIGLGGRVVVEQGFEIDRPSRLYLDVADPIRVGGKVHPVLSGTFAF